MVCTRLLGAVRARIPTVVAGWQGDQSRPSVVGIAGLSGMLVIKPEDFTNVLLRTMKILHVLSTPRAEGTPNMVLDWLATGEQEQEVFVLNSQPADLTDRLRAGTGWYDEADFYSWGRRKFTGMTARVRRVCLERRPDVL